MIVAVTFKRNIFFDATIGEMAAEFSQVLRGPGTVRGQATDKSSIAWYASVQKSRYRFDEMRKIVSLPALDVAGISSRMRASRAFDNPPPLMFPTVTSAPRAAHLPNCATAALYATREMRLISDRGYLRRDACV